MTLFTSYLQILGQGSDLSREDMIDAMRQLMTGSVDEAQMSEFLTLLSKREPTVEEITGAALVLREKVSTINAPDDVIDCCGTGGDSSGTYNISTAVALVVAACGVPVAKHGNRAASSKSGAADVLEELGVNLSPGKDKLENALKSMHFCFLMAPNHHPAMGHVRQVRKQLGFRTIFNILGPLANPAGARLQLLGVYDKKLLLPMAKVLKNLGTERAWIVCGEDGLDEITTTGNTFIAVLSDGIISERIISPNDFGLPISPKDTLIGGNAKENAQALKDLLGGKKSAYRDIVLANTAAALCIHNTSLSLKDGVEIASRAIDTGAARKILDDYVAFTKESQ